MNKEKVFSIEKCYKATKDKDNYIDLPLINVYQNTRHAIFISDKSKDLLGDKFINLVKFNKNQIISNYSFEVTSRATNTDLKRNIYFGDKDKKLFNGVGFLNLATSVDIQDEIPLISKYNEISNYSDFSNSLVSSLEQTLYKYAYPLKTMALQLLKENIGEMANGINIFKTNYVKLCNDIYKNLNKYSPKELLNKSVKANEMLELFLAKSLKTYTDFFESFFSKFEYFFDATQSNIDYLGDVEIKNLKTRLNYVKLLNTYSRNTVDNMLALRDTRESIDILNKVYDRIYHNGKQRIKAMLNKYNEAGVIYTNKALYFNADNAQSQYLLKKAILSKYIYNFLKKKANSLIFLTKSEVDDLIANLDLEIKLFISNNLSSANLNLKYFAVSKINRIINEEFYFNLDNYIIHSETRKDELNVEIKRDNGKYTSLKLIKKATTNDHLYDAEIKRIKEQIDYSISTSDWKNKRIQNEFYKLLRSGTKINSNFKVLVEAYKECQKTTSKFKCPSALSFFTLLNKNKNNPDFVKALKNINRLYKLFASYTIFYDKIVLVKSVVYGRMLLSNNFIINFLKFYRFVELLNKSSIDIGSLVKTFDSLPSSSRMKLNLISLVVTKPKVLFICDDPYFTDIKAKKEFLRVAEELCLNATSSYVFVTNDRRVIDQNYFDYLYVINNNKEVEFGLSNLVINSPISPYVKKDLNNQEISQEILKNPIDFIYSDIFDVEDDHFIVSPSRYFKTWMKGHKNENKIISAAEEQSQEKTSATRLSDLESPFLEDTVFISALSELKENKVSSSKKVQSNYSEDISKQPNILQEIKNAHEDAF